MGKRPSRSPRRIRLAISTATARAINPTRRSWVRAGIFACLFLRLATRQAPIDPGYGHELAVPFHIAIDRVHRAGDDHVEAPVATHVCDLALHCADGAV